MICSIGGSSAMTSAPNKPSGGSRAEWPLRCWVRPTYMYSKLVFCEGAAHVYIPKPVYEHVQNFCGVSQIEVE